MILFGLVYGSALAGITVAMWSLAGRYLDQPARPAGRHRAPTRPPGYRARHRTIARHAQRAVAGPARSRPTLAYGGGW